MPGEKYKFSQNTLLQNLNKLSTTNSLQQTIYNKLSTKTHYSELPTTKLLTTKLLTTKLLTTKLLTTKLLTTKLLTTKLLTTKLLTTKLLTTKLLTTKLLTTNSLQQTLTLYNKVPYNIPVSSLLLGNPPRQSGFPVSLVRKHLSGSSVSVSALRLQP